MASLSRSVIRVISSCSRNIAIGQICINPATPLRTTARSLAFLSSSSNLTFNKNVTRAPCSCGCGIHGVHTKGDREIVEFLQGEIVGEKNMLKGNGQEPLPTTLCNFDIKYEKADISLTKTFNDEKITISANVNHSAVDQDPPQSEEEEPAPIKCSPNFDIDIKIGSKTLSFTMSFVPQDESEDMQGEDFGISEVTIYDGEWEEKTYAVSGDLLDETLYDLFMNMLYERGITSEFASKFGHLCTDYEHRLYVKMLETIHSTIKRN